MQLFKKKAYTLYYPDENVVVLDPFDYIILTYQYTPPLGEDYDLDTLSTFRYPSSTLSGINASTTVGVIPGTGVVGCGASSQAADTTIPINVPINTAYMVYGGDDVDQTGTTSQFGESIVVNFKNLKDAGITTSPDVVVELFAGWQAGPSDYPITVKYETFIGGTISLETVGGVISNRYVSTGTPVSAAQVSLPIPVPIGYCGNGVDIKKNVTSIFFNLDTKVSSVVFH